MFSPNLLLMRASGYNNRVMVFAHRRQKSRYLPPKAAHVRSPLAHKQPEEYHNTWDPRSGVEWHNRLRNRNHYRHWPWAWWTDDPIRHHRDLTYRRTLSAKETSVNEGYPLWDYYSEVGQEYKTPSHFPLTYVAPFIHLYTAKVWSSEELRSYLSVIMEEAQLKRIQDVADNIGKLRRWGEVYGGKSVPKGLIQHVELVCLDVVAQNDRIKNRQQLHQQSILRTNEMERYYTLPHLHGPAMPTTRAQAPGVCPQRFTWMQHVPKFHPLQLPDRWKGANCYPA